LPDVSYILTKMEHFLKRIATKYNLNNDEIISEWKQFDELNTSYNKMKKPELVKLCVDKGYKSSGSKPELITYLIDEVKEDEVKPQKKTTKTASMKPVVTQVDIIKKIVAASPVIVIRRNKYGNYEHPDSCFIFNQTTKKVIGKQEDDGSVSPITKSDIDTCNKYNFDYEIPECLDNKLSGLMKEDCSDNMVDDIDLNEDELIESDMNVLSEDEDEDIEYVDDA